MAALAVPGVSNRLAQGMADTGADVIDAGRRFVTDEYGGMKLYHGSPHDFDKFSMSKIGTGEGAQAYGHGLYFTEDETIARHYRDKVGAMLGSGQLQVDGRNIDWDNPLEAAAFELMRHGGDREAAADFAERRFRGSQVPQIIRSGVQLPEVKSPGRMYEVEVNANPEDFLDWDRPLSEQSQRVQDAAERARRAYLAANYPNNPEYLNGNFPAHLKEGLPAGRAIGSATAGNATSPIVAKEMREAGIPGIRYLDAGSRGAADGSRNYVVFDDKMISILRKYGLVPGMVGANALAMDDEKQQIRDYLGGM